MITAGARRAVELGEVVMAVRRSADLWQNVLLRNPDSSQHQLQSLKYAVDLEARALFVIECSCLSCVPGYVLTRLELELCLVQPPDHSLPVLALAELALAEPLKRPAVAEIYEGTHSYLFVSALCLPFGHEFVPVLTDLEVYPVLASDLYYVRVL